MLLVLAAVPLVGAVIPEQIPYLVQAQQFRVIDANGVRIGLNAEGITYYDENGMRRATMERDGVSYSDENDTLRLSMGVFGTGSGIVYYDENSNPRAAMGKVALATPATGAATSYQTQVAL